MPPFVSPFTILAAAHTKLIHKEVVSGYRELSQNEWRNKTHYNSIALENPKLNIKSN